MHFAIGTRNKPKSEAVEHVLSVSPYTSGATFSNHAVPSGVPDMPTTLEEIRTGAKNRALYCRREMPDADYFVGMEGGVYQDREGENYWIMGCVYIEDREGKGYFGYSYHIEIPEKVRELLLDGSGKDLETIMHSLGSPKNIGDEGGTPAQLTDGMLVRKDEFIAATQASLAPHFNRFYRL